MKTRIADTLRELLMPATVLTIVATVWSLAWAGELASKETLAGQPARCYVEQHEASSSQSSPACEQPACPPAPEVISDLR